ncbi:hypothetical protein BS47DRAFT_1415327 [Hydnum rufescens UP504]|uniref:T6SS Phospholipase effector Tle1-like catalytic domain-containing protein n=1 Tax=Hydnum rufescens UP504 TaxID=1448309 RepID=A0A9P6AN91_9AGAM|nr:hypothetical protein BS47DRAFT_1415327 [Hydnum rufescens UP504]
MLPAPASENRRTLILCFDGTSNEFGDTNTNVVKLFSFLEKDNPKQHVYYQSGVGTYIGPGFLNSIGKWIAKAADLAVAWYLDEHIMGGYRFLQTVWQPDDRICLFGFSRGAYTARALAGMLYRVGLLPPEMPEQVDFAYSMFKAGITLSIHSAAYKRAFSRTVTIEFLGVWDTVSSVGGVIPRELPFSADNHITKTFRHALALDEHRARFRSNTWHLTVDPKDGHQHNPDAPQPGIVRAVWHKFSRMNHRSIVRHEAALNDERLELDMEGGLMDRPPTDVKEVWFPGCHGDVGGGKAPDEEQYALSNVPLRWMIKEIIIADPGIHFRKSEMARHGINHDHLVAFAAAQSEAAKIGSDSKETLKCTEAEAILQHQRDVAARTSVDGGHEPEAEIPKVNGNDTTPTAEPEKQNIRWRKDAVSPITDVLVTKPAWWLLEIFPFMDSKQDQHGHWTSYLRINGGRGRDIPKPPDHSNPNSGHNNSNTGVNISDTPALFHLSVKQRMESPECNVATWRSLWRKKNKPYRPRAWPTTGDPVYVE